MSELYGKTREVWLRCEDCDDYTRHAFRGVTDDMEPVIECGECGRKDVYVYKRRAR